MNRYVLVILSLMLSIPAFANDLDLDSDDGFIAAEPSAVIDLTQKKMEMPASTVTVARTAATPDKVVLKLPVKMGYRVCVKYDTRMVFGQDPSCGYTYVRRRVCHRDDHGHVHCHYRDVAVMRSCYYPVTYCSQYGTQYVMQTKKLRLKFKDLPVLTGEQKDVFTVDATQTHYDANNASFNVKEVQTSAPYEINVSNFLNRAKIKRK